MATLAANSIEGRAGEFLQRIDNLYDEMATLKGEYLVACKQRRDDIREILLEAKDKGIPVKVLRKTVKYRELERQQEALRSGFDDMDEAAKFNTLIEAYGNLSNSLGDTPMGSYAHKRAKELKGLNGE